jgi:hypothetical protein
MMDMNIEKNTQAFSQLFPEECEKHFNLLAKRRFKSGDTSAQHPTTPDKDEGEGASEGKEGKPERTKKKSALERRLAEKMAAAGESKSEQELVQEVVAELKEKENKEGRQSLSLP